MQNLKKYSQTLTEDCSLGRMLNADLDIIYNSIIRSYSVEEFFHNFLELRDLGIRLACLNTFVGEIKIRLDCMLKKQFPIEIHDYGYELLQLIDYFDIGDEYLCTVIDFLFDIENDKTSRRKLASCFPFIIGRLGSDDISVKLSKNGISVTEIQATDEWMSAVCAQPLFLIYHCCDTFLEICKNSDSHRSRLAYFLYDLLVNKYISKTSILFFFDVKYKYKLFFIKALRRYSVLLQGTTKEVINLSCFENRITSSIDIVFSCMLGLKFNNDEFYAFLLKNKFGLTDQELAFCFSNKLIFAKTASFLNSRLKAFDLSALSLSPVRSIDMLFRDIVNSPSASISSTEFGKVTVITTTKNPNINLLMLSIQSIRKQSYKNIEIIIIDDCSDNSIEIQQSIRSFSDIIYYRSDINNGTYISRNLAIKMSTGEFIAFQDDDDVSHPQRIEYQIRKFCNSDVAVMTVSHVRFDSNAKMQVDIGTNVISDGPVTMVVRKKIFDLVGLFKPLRSRGDVEFRERCRHLLSEGSLVEEEIPLYYAYGSHQTLSSSFEYSNFTKLELQRKIMSMEDI